MTEQWRNPWAPSDDVNPDDDSSESSISRSTPIEPGRVVQVAPHNVFAGPSIDDDAPDVLPEPAVVPVAEPASEQEPIVAKEPSSVPRTDPSFFAPPVPPQPVAATMPTEVISHPVERAEAPEFHLAGDVVVSSSVTNTVDREDFDRTVISRATNQMWTLKWATGQSPLFSIGLVVVGRNPTPPAEFIGAQTVAVDDVTRTVSKTHALFEYIGGVWYVTDMQSTNGVVLVSESGLQTDAVPGQRTAVTPHMLLGDLDVRLEQVES